MLVSYAVILGLLPSAIWLFLFSREDSSRPEPISALLYAFVVGILATFLALGLQILLHNYLLGIGYPDGGNFQLLAFATIEEVVKFVGVFLLVSRLKDFDEPLDAMIYMITIALGFAAVENVGSLLREGSLEVLIASGKAFEIIFLRTIGATLLHTVASAIVGFHWAVSIIRKRLLGFYLFVGLIVASVLHGIFNYLIIKTGPNTWAIAFVAFIVFFVLVDFEALKAAEK